MDIQVDIKHVVDDLRCVKVSLYEFTNQKGKNVDVMIWVPNCDSISEIELAAKKNSYSSIKSSSIFFR